MMAGRIREYKLTLRLLLENPASLAGVIIVLVFAGIAIIDQIDPHLIGVENAVQLIPNFKHPTPQAPSFAHPLGTTFPGVDLYQAIMAAISIDLFYSLVIVLGGAAIGTIIGVIAGYYGGILDEALMRFTDIFLSVPYLPLAIAFGFLLGREIGNISLALIIVWWPLYARYSRAQTLTIKSHSFVEASRASGVGGFSIMLHDITPNVLTPTFVQISLDLGTVVAVFAGLNFIGFASSALLYPELGTLISTGFQYAIIYPWTVVFPGLTILILAIGMNLLGDGLRDALDPRRRTSLS